MSGCKHAYKIGDKNTIERDVDDDVIRFMEHVNEAEHANEDEYANESPHTITKVRANGTIRIQRGNNSEHVNMRRVCPYFDSARVY